jgi:DNA-binding transcriptional LysR family regulator
MSITFRQLEVFVAAAEDCNFRRTADYFGISQPSVSNHIRSLESHLGVCLFDRSRGIAPALSAEGREFLDRAQHLVSGRAGIEESPIQDPDGRAVCLTVMAGPLLLDACIRPKLPAFCATHPRIALQFVPLHPSRSTAQLMNSGDVDLAVFTGDCAIDGRWQSDVAHSIGCAIYASPALARRASLTSVRLGELPWVMPPEDFAPTRFMWRALRGAGVRLRNVIARSQFPDVAANMALSGHGVTVLFDDVAAKGVADGRLVRIGPALPSTSRLLLIGRRARSAACEPAVRMLRQAVRTPLTGAANISRL